MKYISQYSDRLSQAFKRIEELEKENIRLQMELVGLRATGKQRTSCLTKSTSTNEQPHYAQPTKTSSNKEKYGLQNPSRRKCMTERIVFISGEPYVYNAGVPLHIALPKTSNSMTHGPRYLHSTNASSNRYHEILDETGKRKRKQEEIEKRRVSPRLPSPSTSWWDSSGWDSDTTYSPPTIERRWGWASNFGTEKELPIEESPAMLSSGDAEVQGVPQTDLAKRSRLDDTFRLYAPAPIEGKEGFSALRRAFEIVQETVFDIVKSGTPGWQGGDKFEDGPHLVRLGRNELHAWMNGKELSYNGRTKKTISDDLLDVVYLRNALCHPSGSDFRDSTEVDSFLHMAQRVTVTLGNENAAMELRGIRETVRDEAKRSLQDMRDMYLLSLMPYHEELRYQPHHVALFKQVLSEKDRGYWNDSIEEQEFVAIASAWDGQHRAG
ncbi:hypothetical protein F5B18DRAFT_666023 [Nemania serpens]|nr:hypothetical protein F5B18DRAFT_666023 [Nemania serpens]